MKQFNKLFLAAFAILILVLYFFPFELSSSQKKLTSTNSSDLWPQYSQIFIQAEKFKLDGEFEKSIRFFERALFTAKKIPDKKNEYDSLIKLGVLYWNIGQLKESSAYYDKALKLAQKINPKSLQEKCLNALEIYRLYSDGKKYRSSSEYQKSIKSFQNAIDLARKAGSKEHEVKCLRQLSITYWEFNNLKKFFSLNKEALNIAKSLSHRKEEGRCLNNIGLFYWKLDNYSKALTCYEDAIKIAKKENNKVNEAKCLNNIGIIYQELGIYEKALEHLRKALLIQQQLGYENSISMSVNNIGETFRSIGLTSGIEENFYKALDYFEDCLMLARKTGDKRTEVYALNNIGTVYSDLKKYYDALKYFQSGYEKAEEIQDAEAMGMLLNNIGIIYFNQGNFEESTRYYQKAIDLALEIKGGQILWEAYLEIAKAYEKQELFSEALESYKKSISTIENIRSQIKLEELKARYLGTDKRIEAYHNLIHLLVNLHHSDPEKTYDIEAFDYIERAKARAFLDSLELSQIDISKSINPELLNQEKELMKDISNIHTKLLATELSPEERKDIDEQLKNYENKLEALKREIRTKSHTYANLKYPEIISLDEARKKLLDADTAFFEYCIGKENSYAFVITKKDLNIFPLPSRDEIKKKVSDYLQVISDKENQSFQLGYELFSELVLPGLTKNIKNIIFIPDDILHFLPFETLITREEKRDWLIKNYKIAYIPSISSLREIIQNKKSNGEKSQMDILAFGDPDFGTWEIEDSGEDIFQEFYNSDAFNFFRLKYSGLEIERISSLFKKIKRNIFQREKATEEQLKNHNLKNYKILHFATHSLIDDKIPARSSIVLSLRNNLTEDGFLQMREIYNLKLNSDLVILSSCQTGRGRFIKGEGIEALNRAFFYAGASSVIMSLWPVNDQASYQLMERFYHHLRSSESIMNALRKAKLEMIDSNILSHPFYWAGFIVTGKADKVIFPRTIKKWVFLGVFFLLAGGIILIAVRRFIF